MYVGPGPRLIRSMLASVWSRTRVPGAVPGSGDRLPAQLAAEGLAQRKAAFRRQRRSEPQPRSRSFVLVFAGVLLATLVIYLVLLLVWMGPLGW